MNARLITLWYLVHAGHAGDMLCCSYVEKILFLTKKRNRYSLGFALNIKGPLTCIHWGYDIKLIF
jgi:hypothetical protein